jgi:hypothetical protein
MTGEFHLTGEIFSLDGKIINKGDLNQAEVHRKAWKVGF